MEVSIIFVVSHPGPSFERSNKETNEGVAHGTKRASLVNALRPLPSPPRGRGGGSVRSKTVQILLDVP
jgi:hypothetical protein